MNREKTVITDRVSIINRLHDEIRSHLVVGLKKAIEIGQLLVDQKSELKHGQWLPWIETNLGFGVDQSEKYMRIFRKRENINSACDRNLSVDSYIQHLRQLESNTEYVIPDKEKLELVEFEDEEMDLVDFDMSQKIEDVPDTSLRTFIEEIGLSAGGLADRISILSSDLEQESAKDNYRAELDLVRESIEGLRTEIDKLTPFLAGG